MQATRLLALTLAIVLSPRLAMTDLVGHLGHSKIEAGASTTETVEPHGAAGHVATTAVARDSAQGHTGTAVVPSSKPKMKGRWGSLRRIPLLRRPGSKAWENTTGQDESCLVILPLTRSFSNSSGASGFPNR